MSKPLENLVYFGAGLLVDRICKNLFGTSLTDVVNKLAGKFLEIESAKELEKRRIVDIMGDTIEGYEYYKGKIRECNNE